jgi:uncharacterized membrane protein
MTTVVVPVSVLCIGLILYFGLQLFAELGVTLLSSNASHIVNVIACLLIIIGAIILWLGK